MANLLPVLDTIRSICGRLKPIHEGLAAVSNKITKQLAERISKLHKIINNLGHDLARQLGIHFDEQIDYDLDRAAEFLRDYASDSPHQFHPKAQPRQTRSGTSLAQRNASRLLHGLTMVLPDIQTLFMKQMPKSGAMPTWDNIRQLVQEINNMSKSATKSVATERRHKRSPTLEAKLHGRLQTIRVTGTGNKDLAQIQLQEQYGPRLAKLAWNGNKAAITLIEMIEKRRHLQEEAYSAPEQLEAVEQSIIRLGRVLGLQLNEDSLDIMNMVRLANSPRSFKSKQQFHDNLTEGLLLNITRLASNALAIPHGEYLVWSTDANSTMLVPTTEARAESREIMPERPRRFDVMTRDLLGCWNKVERVIGEDHDDRIGDYENPASGDERIGRPGLKAKVQAAGGVRKAAELTGLSPGDISKHVNNREFGISNDSVHDYMRGIGVDPDDIYKYGEVSVSDYGDDERESEREREESEREYKRSERLRARKSDKRRKPD